MPTIVAFETLTELYLNVVQEYENSSKTAFAYKPASGEAYQPVTWARAREDVRSVAGFLMEQNIKKGDRIAILSENRYEWAVTDLAVQWVGAINVALETTLTASQWEFVVKNSGSKLFVVSTEIQLKKAAAIFRTPPDLISVMAFEEPKAKKDMGADFVSLF